MGEFSGKTAVVTGASGGIGRAIVMALARQGADIIAADLDHAAVLAVADEAQGRHAKVTPCCADVSDEGSVLKMFSITREQYETVDVLVNAAGICRMVPILDISAEEWDRMMAINLRSVFLCSREAFRIMKEHQSGKIISIASAAAKIGGVAAGAHYSASKAGVICFTKSLALQAAPYHINVNSVCPGPTSTTMTDAWGDDTNRAFAASIPWKEYGRPADVAEAVVFLASSRARYITGEILDVNGGLVMD